MRRCSLVLALAMGCSFDVPLPATWPGDAASTAVDAPLGDLAGDGVASAACDACAAGAVCAPRGGCVACGQTAQLCCPGLACASGLACIDDGTCWTCGARGAACCRGGRCDVGACDHADGADSRGTCR